MKHPRYEVYPARTAKGRPPRWGVRFKARNGQVYTSAELFTRRRDAVRSALAARYASTDSDVVILDTRGSVIATPLEVVR